MTSTPPPGVCFLISDFDGQGGVQMHGRRLVEQLAGAGARVVVCTRNYHHRATREERGTLSIRRTGVLAPPDPRAITSHPPLLSRAALSSAWFLLSGFLWCYTHRAEYGVIHCQQMSGPLLLGLVLKRFTGKPVIVRVTLSGPTGEATVIRSMPGAALRLRMLRHVDRWVALTKAMAGELETLGIPASRIAVIANSAPIPGDAATDDSVKARARADVGVAGKVVLYVGRLSREKGLHTLVHAWASVVQRHDDAVLILLGGGGSFGAARDDLQKLAEALGLREVIRFQGHVQNVLAYLFASDLFVLPTTAEGMSNALVEAMAAGVAIVTTDIAPHEGLVAHGETALLVPPGDVEALAAAIDTALADPALRLRLGGNARAKAIRDHRLEAMTDAYIEEYRRLTHD